MQCQRLIEEFPLLHWMFIFFDNLVKACQWTPLKSNIKYEAAQNLKPLSKCLFHSLESLWFGQKKFELGP